MSEDNISVKKRAESGSNADSADQEPRADLLLKIQETKIKTVRKFLKLENTSDEGDSGEDTFNMKESIMPKKRGLKGKYTSETKRVIAKTRPNLGLIKPHEGGGFAKIFSN
jgi:hypothetical protein